MKGRVRSARPFSAIAAAALVASGIGVWIASPRFDLKASLVDDWSAISASPRQLHEMVRLTYHESGRFRPSWVVWNYVQWHSFGAPASLAGPNVWGVVRLALVAAGLASVTALLLGGRTRGWRVVLAALPPILVLTTPAFGVDFARFGPQEPLLIAGMTLGGALLLLGAREVACSGRPVRRAYTAATLSLGYAFWLLGVYQKETSLCVLVLVPFAFLRDRTSLRRLLALSRRRRVALSTLAVLVAFPLVHVGYEVVTIARQGQLVYGMHVPTGSHNLGLFKDAVQAMPDVLGSWSATATMIAVAVGIGVSAVLRRPSWTVIGLFVTALAALAWSSQSGFAAASMGSRYFMPTVALLAIALSLQVAALPAQAGWIAVAAIVGVAVWSVPDGHSDVARWAATERQENAFVDAVAAARATGCSVVVTGLDVERRLALPVLVDLRRKPRRACTDDSFFLGDGTYDPDPALVRACPEHGRTMIGSWALALERIELVHCGPPAPASAVALVRRNRLA